VERYKRRESSVEEALVEMYLAGVSVRRVEDITEALWGTRVSSGTVSRLNQKIYRHIEAWRNRAITGEFPYVYLDGVILKRSWAGEVKNISVLIAANRRLRIDARSSVVVAITVKHLVAKPPQIQDGVHAPEYVVFGNQIAERSHHKQIVLPSVLRADHLESHTQSDTLTYYAYPSTHWRQIRTNNPLERIIREIRRRTRVVGAFPDGRSALMLVAARLRHIASTKCGKRRYLVMDHLLNPAKQEAEAAA
jgi:putative transposase